MNKNRVVKTILALFFVVALHGCGGGNSAPPVPAGDSLTPVGTIIDLSEIKRIDEVTGAQGSSISYTMTGSVCNGSNCNHLTATETVVVTAPTVTTGDTYRTKWSTMTITNTNTGVVSSITWTTYYSTATGKMVMSEDSDGIVGVPSSFELLPATPKVGDSGNYDVIDYSDGTHTTDTWRIDPGYNGNAVIVFTFENKDSLGHLIVTSDIIHTIKPDGTIIDISIKDQWDDGTIVVLKGTRN